jgi:hypothetical protein
MAYAIRRAYELGASADDTQHMMLRFLGARLDARSAADTARGIDDRMEGHRIVKTRSARFFVRSQTDSLEPVAPTREPDEQQEGGQPVNTVNESVHFNFESLA